MSSTRGTEHRVERLKGKLRSRALTLLQEVDDSLDFAIDRLTVGYSDSYSSLDDRLEYIRAITGKILDGIGGASGLPDLRILENRIAFLEERFDELNSKLRNQPRRRRRRWNLADLFAAAGGERDRQDPHDGVGTHEQAYAVLGLSPGTALRDVTTAFRRKVKELHPDSNNGDRSSEAELRKLIEAYQFLKSTEWQEENRHETQEETVD
jgi:hypothetical protein